MKEVIELSKRLMAFAATLANEEEDLVNEAAKLADAYEAMERRLEVLRADTFHHHPDDVALIAELRQELERGLADLEQQNSNAKEAAAKFVVAMRRYMITAESAENLCYQFDMLRQENATLRGQVAELEAEVLAYAERDAGASL